MDKENSVGSERFCRKCLLKDMTDGEYYRTIREYIENLPEERKASPDLREKRLAICKECDNLINGMCRLCGCFVEVRAAKKDGFCAKSREIW